MGKVTQCPAETWDNATIFGQVDDDRGGLKIVLKPGGLPGHSNTCYPVFCVFEEKRLLLDQEPRMSVVFVTYTGGHWSLECGKT